jgi:hypothetical protein
MWKKTDPCLNFETFQQQEWRLRAIFIIVLCIKRVVLMNDSFYFNFNIMSLSKLKSFFVCYTCIMMKSPPFQPDYCLVMISVRFLGRIRGLCSCRLHSHHYANPSIVRSISLSLWDFSWGRSLSSHDTIVGTGIIRGDNSSSKSSRREYGKIDWGTLPCGPQDRRFFVIMFICPTPAQQCLIKFAGFN